MNDDAFGHSWGNRPIIFTRDCVTRENYCRIIPLVIHGSPYIILYSSQAWNRKLVSAAASAPMKTLEIDADIGAL